MWSLLDGARTRGVDESWFVSSLTRRGALEAGMTRLGGHDVKSRCFIRRGRRSPVKRSAGPPLAD